MKESPIFLARRVVQKFSDAYAAELVPIYGRQAGRALTLTLPQYFTLRAIARFDQAPSQTDLVEATGIDRSTMAALIRGLRRRGFITRVRRKDDARAYAIRVSEEGAKIVAKVAPIVERVERNLLAKIPAKNRDAFLATLEQLAFLEIHEPEAVQQKRAA